MQTFYFEMPQPKRSIIQIFSTIGRNVTLKAISFMPCRGKKMKFSTFKNFKCSDVQMFKCTYQQ